MITLYNIKFKLKLKITLHKQKKTERYINVFDTGVCENIIFIFIGYLIKTHFFKINPQYTKINFIIILLIRYT